MTNILKAIVNISNLTEYLVTDNYKSVIRIQQIGDSLEYFIKDAFCDTFNLLDLQAKQNIYSHCFSYIGNSNNPPDIMIKNGDAIEVKKIENLNSTIALNSSYPKNKFHISNNRITKACRDCEEWSERDIIYSIGTVKASKLLSLWMVYGDVYAASSEVYEKIANSISSGLNNIHDIEFAKTTRELGSVKKVDPMGITNLRIRGMWGIKHPSSIYDIKESGNNILNAVMRDDKYHSFPPDDIKSIENHPRIQVNKIKVRNPDNPAILMNAVHIGIKITCE